MKFSLERTINKSRVEVWEFFTDAEKTRLWQPSLQSIEIVEGMAGQPGAISKWTYKENEREFSLTEKVLKREVPERFESQFENEFAIDIVNNVFIEQSDHETLWMMETTYRFKTLLMKILGSALKKNYVLRSEKEMERFKEIVEQQ